MILFLIIIGILFSIGMIRKIFFKKIIINEDKKIEYFERRYKNLEGTIDRDTDKIISLITIEEPYNEKENWKVFKLLKSKGFLGNDERVLFFEISDKDLELENPYLGKQ